MRNKILFSLVLLFFCKDVLSQNSKDPFYSFDFRIKELEGSLKFIVDTLPQSRVKIAFNYEYKNNKLVSWEDSSFTFRFSEWEFNQKINSLVDNIIKTNASSKTADSLRIKNNISTIVFQQGSQWYKDVLKKINAIDENKSAVKNVEQDPPTFSVRYIFNDSSYRVIIEPDNQDYKLTVCELKSNFSPSVDRGKKDSCLIENIDENISANNFSQRFINKMENLTNVDLKKDMKQLDSLARRFYASWRKQITDFETKQTVKKEETALVEGTNKKIGELQDAINELLKSKRDSATADFAARMEKIPLYARKIYIDNKLVSEKEARKISKARKSNPNVSSQISESNISTDSLLLPTNENINEKPGIITPQTTAAIKKNYYYYEKTDTTIKIDSMSIRVEGGFITSVILYPDSIEAERYNLNRLTAFKRSIDLRSAREASILLNSFFRLESNRKKYEKARVGENSAKEPHHINIYSDYFLNLNDILKYIPRIDSIGDIIVHVKNRNISFSKSTPKSIRLDEKDFRSFAQLNIFSDLVGLTEDKPNGLIQAEGKFIAGLITQPMNNKRYYSGISVNIFHSASLGFSINKVENKLRYLFIPKGDIQLYNSTSEKHLTDTAKGKRYANTISLQQFSSFEFSAKVNVLKFSNDHFTFLAYLGAGIMRTPVNDTTKGTADANGVAIVNENKTVVNTMKAYWGFKGILKSNHSVALEFGLEAIRYRLNSDSIFQTYNYYSNRSVPRTTNLRESKFGKIFIPHVIVPNLTIMIFLDKDQQRRIYIRSNYYYTPITKADDFLSLQLGYSSDINGIFSFLKKDKEK